MQRGGNAASFAASAPIIAYTHANLEDKRQAMDSMQQAFTKREDGESSQSTNAA